MTSTVVAASTVSPLPSSSSPYMVGTLVWLKQAGYAWWPSLVIDPASVQVTLPADYDVCVMCLPSAAATVAFAHSTRTTDGGDDKDSDAATAATAKNENDNDDDATAAELRLFRGAEADAALIEAGRRDAECAAAIDEALRLYAQEQQQQEEVEGQQADQQQQQQVQQGDDDDGVHAHAQSHKGDHVAAAAVDDDDDEAMAQSHAERKRRSHRHHRHRHRRHRDHTHDDDTDDNDDNDDDAATTTSSTRTAELRHMRQSQLDEYTSRRRRSGKRTRADRSSNDDSSSSDDDDDDDSDAGDGRGATTRRRRQRVRFADDDSNNNKDKTTSDVVTYNNNDNNDDDDDDYFRRLCRAERTVVDTDTLLQCCDELRKMTALCLTTAAAFDAHEDDLLALLRRVARYVVSYAQLQQTRAGVCVGQLLMAAFPWRVRRLAEAVLAFWFRQLPAHVRDGLAADDELDRCSNDTTAGTTRSDDAHVVLGAVGVHIYESFTDDEISDAPVDVDVMALSKALEDALAAHRADDRDTRVAVLSELSDAHNHELRRALLHGHLGVDDVVAHAGDLPRLVRALRRRRGGGGAGAGLRHIATSFDDNVVDAGVGSPTSPFSPASATMAELSGGNGGGSGGRRGVAAGGGENDGDDHTSGSGGRRVDFAAAAGDGGGVATTTSTTATTTMTRTSAATALAGVGAGGDGTLTTLYTCPNCGAQEAYHTVYTVQAHDNYPDILQCRRCNTTWNTTEQ